VHYETKEAATLALRQWHNTERSVFANEQAKYRATVLSRSWINGSGHRNLIESAIAYERAIKHAAMQERRALERMHLRQQYRPFPSLEQWQRQRGRADLADAWRNRASEPMQMTGPKDAPAVDPLKHDIRDFVSQIVGYEIHYSRANGKPEFIDWGDRVDVNAWRDRDVTFAAMQLGMAKWGEVCVIGSDAYKTLCINIAAQHGLKISNPELQDRIEAEGIRLRDARALAVQSEKFNDAETAKRNDADHTTPTSDFSSPSI
jgi:hypothetical protein